jgi:hypothetical protein
MDWLIVGAIDWLARTLLATLNGLWGLLTDTVFVTPDVTALPQVAAITSRSQTIVNVCFVLAVITAGITVMTHDTLQVRYGVGELAPRLVLGWIAANFATPLCKALIELANALTEAFTGDGIDSHDSFTHMQRVVTAALTDSSDGFLMVVIGLVIAVLTGMLMVTWLVRIGLLVVLVGIAPVALACHATPYTDGAARLWWRAFLGCLGTVLLQALALHTALSIFLSPQANLPAVGLPQDPTGTINLFIVACLLWTVVKIPGLMRRYVTHSGQNNVAGLFLRMVAVQQVTRLFRLPKRRGAARAAAAAGAGGGRTGGTGGIAGSVATTVIPYWRPRMPRPTPAATRGAPTPSARTTRQPATPARTTTSRAGANPANPTRPAPLSRAQPPPARRVQPGINPGTAMPRRRPGWRPPPPTPWGSTPRNP